jgi:histidine triad (HIT) family protein
MACIFCEIAARQRSADIVYEDEHAVAFRDVRPQAPVHILIVPREHIVGPSAIDGANEQIAGHLVAVAVRIAQQEGIAADGYRLVLNQGVNGGQSVFHLHLHLLAGRRMGWPPG